MYNIGSNTFGIRPILINVRFLFSSYEHYDSRQDNMPAHLFIPKFENLKIKRNIVTMCYQICTTLAFEAYSGDFDKTIRSVLSIQNNVTLTPAQYSEAERVLDCNPELFILLRKTNKKTALR